MSRSASPAREELAIDHPGLAKAVGRLRRTLWVWAGLFVGMGFLAWATMGRTHPIVALSWLAIGILLLIDRQPAFLALVAAQWASSLTSLVPGVAATLGGDPVSLSLGATLLEVVGLAVVRIVLMVTAWNQFLFYRMLYGTARASGLDPNLPAIPEVVRNRSDSLAWASRALSFAACAFLLALMALRTIGPAAVWLSIAQLAATLAIGLGLGSAFSPTRRRAAAMTGVGLGLIAYVGSLAASAFLATGRGA